MENFSGQLKKYKVTINDLLEENQKLEARARASESGKMKDRMERAKLESELQNLQRLVDRILPEVLAELKRGLHYGKERRFYKYQIQKGNRGRNFSGKGNHAGKPLPGVHAGVGSGETPGAGAAAL